MIQNELNASFKFMELLSTLLWEPACSSLAATKPTRTEILKIKNHFDKSLFFFSSGCRQSGSSYCNSSAHWFAVHKLSATSKKKWLHTNRATQKKQSITWDECARPQESRRAEEIVTVLAESALNKYLWRVCGFSVCRTKTAFHPFFLN